MPVPGTSQGRPRFSVDASIEPGDQGAPEVRFDYRMARSELLFERAPDGYHAAYDVRVVFRRSKGGRQVAGDVFQRDLRVPTYAETRSRGDDIVDHVTLKAPAGKYDVDVVIGDLVAQREAGTTVSVEVPSQSDARLWFTDLSLGTAGSGPVDPADLRASLDPRPSRRFTDDVNRLAVFGEIVDSRPEGERGSTYRLEYKVLNDIQDRVAHGDTVLPRRGGRTPFLLRPGIGTLIPGSYRFVVELALPAPQGKGGRKPSPVTRERAFEVAPSIASILADPKGSIEVLRYIANDAEKREMETLKTEEARRQFWTAFWKRRDPTPDTPQNEAMDEFYQRVLYANQHFSVGTPGWKTDMGRIYIVYGKPDEVVRNPFNFDRPPEEIWYYYRERKTFVFVDRDGFGRYELDPNRAP
ncbi:MAG: GWxTD domain-containing protein [Hyphomicrobiales bacterium]